MAHKDADLEKIKKIIEIMKKNELVEVELKHGDDKILLKRAQPQQIIAAPAMMAQVAPVVHSSQGAQAPAQEQDGLVEIKSPIVGTFYEAPGPDSEPCVEVDSHVNSQTVVCIVEAMKVMNEIKAETTGVIAEVLVTNGQAVEYGQVLFKVRSD